MRATLRKIASLFGRVAQLVFLLLGLPLLILLPTGYAVPSWWDPAVETVLFGAVGLCLLFFALLGTWLLYVSLREVKKRWADTNRLRVLVYFTVLTGLTAYCWWYFPFIVIRVTSLW